MPPARVVSLVPSLTELVFWLGAGAGVAGRTRFCTEPAGEVGHVPTIGGTKNPHIDKIIELAPDLILANKEENRREDIDALRAAGLEVFLTDPNTVEQAVAMIRDIGCALSREAAAEELAAEVEALLASSRSAAGPRVYVGVWHQPMMGLGSESYGHSLLEACGALNVLADRPRYPAVTIDEVAALRPDVILLPDEPFPFDEGHARAYGAIAPARVMDGKLLWWYGPRIPAAIRELRTLFAEVCL